MGRLKNEFAWSLSKGNTLEACERRFWFQTYGKWNGWILTAPARTREIYLLSKLKSRHMWAGELVHDTIENTVRRLRAGILEEDPDARIRETVERMRREFAASQRKAYRANPARVTALYEHEYGQDVPAEQWLALRRGVEQALANFYHDEEAYSMLTEVLSDQWFEIEQFSSFQFEGVKVYVVLDCAFSSGAGATIIDWKTGKKPPGSNMIQLGVYALYAMDQWNIEPDGLNLVEYNLTIDEKAEIAPTAELLEETRAHMRRGIEAMRAKIVDGDTERNNPLPEDQFALAEDPSACRGCNFVRVCPKHQEEFE